RSSTSPRSGRLLRISNYRRGAATLTPPAAVALAAAPAIAVTRGVSAPIPARAMPSSVVPAVAMSAVAILHLLNDREAIGRRAHARRRNQGIGAAGDRQ